MTLREKIADWITGGALSAWKDAYRDQDARIMGLLASNCRLRDRLCEIIAQDTPSANATVKRMVKIAKGGLWG